MSNTIVERLEVVISPIEDFVCNRKGIRSSASRYGLIDLIDVASGFSTEYLINFDFSDFCISNIFEGVKSTVYPVKVCNFFIYIPFIPGLALVVYEILTLFQDCIVLGEKIGYGIKEAFLSNYTLLKQAPKAFKHVITTSLFLVAAIFQTIPIFGAFLGHVVLIINTIFEKGIDSSVNVFKKFFNYE